MIQSTDGTIQIDNKTLLEDLLDDNIAANNPQNHNVKELSQISRNLDVRKMYLESPTFAKEEEDLYRYVQSRLSVNDYANVKTNDIMDSLDMELGIMGLDINKRIQPNSNTDDNDRTDNLNNYNSEPNKTNNNQRLTTLMSDIAVASLPKQEAAQHLAKPLKSNFDNDLFDQELLDSLDYNRNNNNNINTNNQPISGINRNTVYENLNQENYVAEWNNSALERQRQQQQQLQQPFSLNYQPQQQYISPSRLSNRRLASYLQPLQSQPLRLPQPPPPVPPIQQSFAPQNQPFQVQYPYLPVQPSQQFLPPPPQQAIGYPVPPNIPPNFVQYHQPQFTPQIQPGAQLITQQPPLPPQARQQFVPIRQQPQLYRNEEENQLAFEQAQQQQFEQQQQQQQQQFEQQQQQQQQFEQQQQLRALQQQQQQQQLQNPNMYSYQEPLLYNSSYPLNLPSNNYFGDDYLSQQFGEPGNQFLNDTYQPPYNNALDTLTTNNDFGMIQQPIPLPRKGFQQQQQGQHGHNLQSQQSNRSYDLSVKQINSPLSFDGDPEDTKDNFDNTSKKFNATTQEELKRQQVWDKLQKANKEIKVKNNNNNNNINGNNSLSKKPPLNNNNVNNTPRRGSQNNKNDANTNYVEENVKAIRHKENLVHRYPLKSYENLQNKKKELAQKFRSHSDTIKKPPVHLEPMYSDNENGRAPHQQMFNSKPYQTQSANIDLNTTDNKNAAIKTISIPITSNIWKDNDRINLDINLRLVDFMNGEGNSLVNRSLDNFGNINNNSNTYAYTTNNLSDPLENHIKKFENKITRSLPGSSGSLAGSFSKFKPLPPLNNLNTNPRMNGGNKLQHEYEIETQENDGYLANLYKSSMRPQVRAYTIKDYRNFKKDTGVASTKSTGKLGFDFDSEDYKEKLDKSQKKLDYAQRVKARNQRLLAEQPKRELPDDRTHTNENSKTQRSKEYIRKVLRANSETGNTTLNESRFEQDENNLTRKNIKYNSMFPEEELEQKLHKNSEKKKQNERHPATLKRSSSLDGIKDYDNAREADTGEDIIENRKHVPIIQKPVIVKQSSKERVLSNNKKSSAQKNQNSSANREQPKKVTTPKKKQIDSAKELNTSNDSSVIRMRDPVTGKVRTINLRDAEIEEMAKRHEEDKVRVNTFMSNPMAAKTSSTKAHDTPKAPTFEHMEKQQRPSFVQQQSIDSYQQQAPKQRVVVVEEEEDEVQKLLNRHKKEKQNAEQIKEETLRASQNYDLDDEPLPASRDSTNQTIRATGIPLSFRDIEEERENLDDIEM